MVFLAYINYIAYTLVYMFELVLLVYCIASWVIRDPFNKFMQILGAIVNPVLTPIRSLLNRISFFRNIPIDFSALIAFLLCNILLSLL